MTIHSKLSASSANRWMKCPGSIDLIESMGSIEQQSSVYAEEGTLAHSLLEYKLRKFYKFLKMVDTPSFHLFQSLDHNLTGVDEEMEECTDMAYNYITDIFNDKSTLDNILIEETLFPFTDRQDIFGTCDFSGLIDGDRLYVIDFKYGKGINVAVENNEQLLYYAVGAANYFKSKISNSNIDICIVIIQPRVTNPIKEYWVKLSDIHEWANTLKIAVAATEAKNAPLISGSHCYWCPAKIKCPKIINQMFDDVICLEPTELIKKPDLVTRDKLINIIKHKSMIESWLESCYSYLQSLAVQGQTIEGFKLVQKKANRKWIDESMVINEFKLLGSSLFEEPKLKSPAQLEKLKGIDKTKLASLYHTPDTGVTLVPEDDKREAAVCVNADTTFKPLN